MLSRRTLMKIGLPATLAAAFPARPAWPVDDVTAPRSPATVPFRASLPVPGAEPPATITRDQLIALLRAETRPIPSRELTDDFVDFIRGQVSDDIDLFDFDMREASVQIIPSLNTTIWGYDGRFPDR